MDNTAFLWMKSCLIDERSRWYISEAKREGVSIDAVTSTARINRRTRHPARCLTKGSLNRDTSENVSLPRKLWCRRFRTHPASLRDNCRELPWIDGQPVERRGAVPRAIYANANLVTPGFSERESYTRISISQKERLGALENPPVFPMNAAIRLRDIIAELCIVW